MVVSKDENFIFIGSISVGIKIFDITKRDNIISFENISQDGLAIKVSLSDNENLIFLCDSFKLIVY